MVLPQPSPTIPQYWPPGCWQMTDSQAAAGGAPPAGGAPAPPLPAPARQPPQSMLLPQPSPILPQYLPPACWQTRGWQAPPGCPHTPARPPPPQVAAPVQPPQSMVLPQPSPTAPQYWPPGCWQVIESQLA